jgi:hypothetical protein
VKAGRDVPIRREIRLRKAVDVMVESADAIDPEQAKTRDKLWTPEKQRKEKGSAQLWTPGEPGESKPEKKPDEKSENQEPEKPSEPAD